MTYAEKLKDPRWQKRRLTIMQRDNFACTECFDTSTTLNVHHLKYHNEPWDSPDDELVTLCEKCHADRERVLKGMYKEIIPEIRLKLKDSFVMSCFIQLLQDWENLHDLVYILWELRHDQINTEELLTELFRNNKETVRNIMNAICQESEQ